MIKIKVKTKIKSKNSIQLTKNIKLEYSKKKRIEVFPLETCLKELSLILTNNPKTNTSTYFSRILKSLTINK